MPVAAAPPIQSELALYGPQAQPVRPTLAGAQKYCRQFAQRNYENFTVASWLLPRSLRQHFANVYAYCRWADDLADETGDTIQSEELLDWWESQLQACYAGRCEHPVFVALADTIDTFEIPLQPFADLLVAFRQDQRIRSYETFEELWQYCRNSANPVGRIVLRLGRCSDSQSIALSDSICTGLQLVNFWQDVGNDWREQGRLYLPEETMKRFKCDENEIKRGVAGPCFRAALAYEVERAEAFLQAGWPLVQSVPSSLKVEVELFIRGGLAVVAAIRRQEYDVLSRRPPVSKGKKLRMLFRAWFRQRVLRQFGTP